LAYKRNTVQNGGHGTLGYNLHQRRIVNRSGKGFSNEGDKKMEKNRGGKRRGGKRGRLERRKMRE